MDYRDLREASVRRGRQHRHGRARRRGADRRVRRQIAAGAGAGRAGPEPRHRRAFRPTSAAPTSAGDFSEPLRVPRRRAAQPLAHAAGLRARRLRGAQRREPHTDYAETLRHWTTRFEEHLDEAERLAGPSACASGASTCARRATASRSRYNAVYQLLCSRPLTEGASAAPTGSRHEPPPRVRPASAERGSASSARPRRPPVLVDGKPVHIGCSGWNYRDWRGAIYPEGLPARRWLERYAELFDTVEVNAPSTGCPRRSAVEDWVEQTPRGFVFAVKASRYLTHVKRLKCDRRGREAILRAARAARGGAEARAGPVAAPGDLPARRRSPGGGARGAAQGPPLLRVPPPELVHPTRSTTCCAATAPRW